MPGKRLARNSRAGKLPSYVRRGACGRRLEVKHDGKTTPPVFPQAGLDCLKRLKLNNNRDWFLKNKTVYEESVHEPMVQLVEALAEEFHRFAPEIVASPKLSLFRIHRDTRFSKDKSPYKTHVAASFRARGLDRHEGAGFYF